MLRLWAVSVATVVGSGCFSFSDAAVAPSGQTARVTLGVTRPLPDGSAEPIRLEGRVVTSTLGTEPPASAAIVLEGRTREAIGNFREVVTLDTTRIAQSDIQRLEVRSFSWFKSGIATLVLGVIAHTMVDRFAPVASNRVR